MKTNPTIIARPLTVRRLTGGGLAIFVDDEPIAGLAYCSIIDDGERCVLNAQFDMHDVCLDTEKVDTADMN